jgi:hypothetical protein
MDGVVWIRFMWLWYRPLAGSCEHGNKPSGSIQFMELLEWLINYWLLKKLSASCTYVSYVHKNNPQRLSLAVSTRAIVLFVLD